MQKRWIQTTLAGWRRATMIVAAAAVLFATRGVRCQHQASAPDAASSTALPASTVQPGQSQDKVLRYRELKSWYGLKIAAIRFEGVTSDNFVSLPTRLPLKPGGLLTAEFLKSSLHQLYATGLYKDIIAEGQKENGQVTLIFLGVPQVFLRRVYVRGMKQELLAAQLQRATRLEIGQPFTQRELDQATEQMKDALARNGFYQPAISVATTPAGPIHQVDVIYTITSGTQAKVGDVTVSGNSGMSVAKFRKVSKLKDGSKVTTNTVPRALNRLSKHYQKQRLLEATVRASKQAFNAPNGKVDYGFDVSRGPTVRVVAIGARVESGDLKRLVPVYEEGSVDADLLDEGDRNLSNHFQKQGYFEVGVTHTMEHPSPDEDLIAYHIELGSRHKVASVRVVGSRYFDHDTIVERLHVQKAGVLNRYGTFSSSLLAGDVDAITALYQSNGFANVTVTPLVVDTDRGLTKTGKKVGRVSVTYDIHEGIQQRIGKVDLTGVRQLSYATLMQQMNTRPGEPYSLVNLAGDRTAILSDYYRHGFSQVSLTMQQHNEKANPNLIDINIAVQEGNPFYVSQVLISGLHYTSPQTVQKRLEVKPGDPLDRNALQDTQRRLYNLALFNEVDSGVVNPNGEQRHKDVLLNLTEAHRWNYNYGFGFEVQTGTPQRHCPSQATLIELGVANPSAFVCSPNGKFGASPRVSFDVSRINIRGRNQTLTLQTAYGTLEQQAILTFDNPNFRGSKTVDFSVSGGYVSSQDITTYQASSITGSARFVYRPNKANTLIYSYAYRYVRVDPNSLQVSVDLIPLLSQPVRVGGPGVTWVYDTRNNPLNATRGSYLSAQQFLAWSGLGSEANFNRLDVQQSNYLRLNKQEWILARSTRIGFENTYGNPGYSTVPLPERLYAGGATSHRGFSINSAGPRDLQTGFPVGGSGAFVNSTELRIPPIALPYIGKNLGFVLFDDLGNVYQNASDIFPSLLRWRQPNRSTCYDLKGPVGTCNFNYDSNATGLGLRYKTPVGPIRLDFSYNLNPTVYPVVADPALAPAFLDYNGQTPYVGNSGRFNFFFSIGQAF